MLKLLDLFFDAAPSLIEGYQKYPRAVRLQLMVFQTWSFNGSIMKKKWDVKLNVGLAAQYPYASIYLKERAKRMNI